MKIKHLERCPKCEKRNMTVRYRGGSVVQDCTCGYLMVWHPKAYQYVMERDKLKSRLMSDMNGDSNTVTS